MSGDFPPLILSIQLGDTGVLCQILTQTTAYVLCNVTSVVSGDRVTLWTIDGPSNLTFPFDYNPGPVITAVSPMIGQFNTTVTITVWLTIFIVNFKYFIMCPL